jgi:hypothetical protein
MSTGSHILIFQSSMLSPFLWSRKLFQVRVIVDCYTLKTDPVHSSNILVTLTC